ncbi:MAG: hypothetical protein AB1391_01615 [Candidatus Micrarchaeota archaeon]
MKIKLTPELSFIIGFWSKIRSKEGLGIEGGRDLQEIFAEQVLGQKLTETNKLLSENNLIYFYHGKYRKFFQQIENEKLERYKYLNEYSASYLAGIFDAVGKINERGVICLEKGGNSDEMLLFRLGFPTRKINSTLIILKPKTFLLFIKNYTRRFKDHPIMKLLKKK